jgi:glucose/arabinose dehydrogenase
VLTPARNAIMLVLCGATLTACDDIAGGDAGPVEVVPGSSTERPAITDAPEIELPAAAVQSIATGLRIPWGLAFLPDGTASSRSAVTRCTPATIRVELPGSCRSRRPAR